MCLTGCRKFKVKIDTFEIQEGSYAWLVMPGHGAKVTRLVIEWSPESPILTVNGGAKGLST